MGLINAFRAALSKKMKQGGDTAATVYGLFEEYRSAYAAEWERLNENEIYYRGDHWTLSPPRNPMEPTPVTPVIQSTVENVAADLMDSYPEAIITPESPEDETAAAVLQAIIAQNHDASGYIKDYRRLSHDLLVGGYMVQEVGYDVTLSSGIGGAFIRHVDNMGILFDPLVTDIQDGRAVIKYEGLPIKVLDERYPDHAPFTADPFTSESGTLADDPRVTRDTAKMALLIEYWWREFDDKENRYRVHMLKAAGGKILEDSRDTKPEGYYSHGEYPFILTTLFPRKGSALGLGLVDMFKDRQMTADKLDQTILKNAIMASRNKLLVTEASGFDAGDLSDWAKDVHVGESLQGVQWFATPPLPQYIFGYVQKLHQDIKEESGANDFSRGAAGGGVTAASAIMALQEMSGKRSRMAARQMQEAFRDAVRMEIEVEREFNVLPRRVFATIRGEKVEAAFDSALLERPAADTPGVQLPIEFYISIKVQKENRWSQMAHNELILQMVQLQVIAPEDAVELMQFTGKEQVLERARQARERAFLMENGKLKIENSG